LHVLDSFDVWSDIHANYVEVSREAVGLPPRPTY
jgi:hypothetical protein